MKLHKLFILAASGLLSLAGVSEATTIGLANPQGAYAIWDTFTSGTTFSGVTPDGGTAGFLTSSLSQSANSSGSGFGPNATDYFYDATKTTAWTVAAKADIKITSITLQIKLSQPFDSSDVGAYFTPLLSYGIETGIGTNAPTVASTGETAQSQDVSVVTWTWTGLDIDANTDFSFSFGRAAGKHVVMDTVAIDAVPEPGTWASLAMGLGLLAGGRRFMRRSK